MSRARLTGPGQFWEESRNCRSVIAAPVRALFKRLGLRDYMRVRDKLAARREHGLYGVPTLGGVRHTRAAIKRDGRWPRVLPGEEVLGRNAAWGIAKASAEPICG